MWQVETNDLVTTLIHRDYGLLIMINNDEVPLLAEALLTIVNDPTGSEDDVYTITVKENCEILFSEQEAIALFASINKSEYCIFCSFE